MKKRAASFRVDTAFAARLLAPTLLFLIASCGPAEDPYEGSACVDVTCGAQVWLVFPALAVGERATFAVESDDLLGSVTCRKSAYGEVFAEDLTGSFDFGADDRVAVICEESRLGVHGTPGWLSVSITRGDTTAATSVDPVRYVPADTVDESCGAACLVAEVPINAS